MKTWKQLEAKAKKLGIKLQFGSSTVMLLDATSGFIALASCASSASRGANDEIQRIFVAAALPRVRQ